MTTFVIAIDAGTPAERGDLTSHLKAKGSRFWHWIDDLWIATGLPENTTAEGLWAELSTIPTLSSKTMLVMAVDGAMKYFGRADQEAWNWLRETGHKVGHKLPQGIPH